MKKQFNVRKIVKLTSIVVVCSLVVTVIASLATGNSLFVIKTINIDESKEHDLSNIQNIVIDVFSDNLKIISTNEEKVRAHFYGEYSSNNKKLPYLSTEVRGDTLNISINQKHSLVIGFDYTSSDCKLDIYLPEEYSNNIKIKKSFGDVNIDELKVNEFFCEASSGNVNIKSLHTKTSNINSSFGNITVENFIGEFNGKSSSGEYDVNFVKLQNDVNIETSFGNVKLKFPKKSDFELDFKSSFGECSNKFPITISGDKSDDKVVKGIVGNGGNKIKVRISSGNLEITN